MTAISEMTVSISKGKTSESSTAHNNRKTRLKSAPYQKIKKFYEQVGHTHIHAEFTKLNEDYIKDPKAVYDKLFEKAIFDYNEKQKRRDRKIGKGLALPVKEKQGKVAVLTMVHTYKAIKSEKKRKQFLETLAKSYPTTAESLKEVLPNFENFTLRDTSKMLTQAKHAKTLGEALYEKQRKSKQASTHTELIFQVGAAEDFNEVDANGRIKKSYDRLDPNGIWQKSKKVLQDFEKNFEKQNPNLIVTNASLHMDEATPHMHVEVVPFAETAKTLARGKKHKGLSVKPSFDGALECEGYKRDPHDSRKAFKQWQHDQSDTLAKLMQKELGVARKKGSTNRLKDIHEYKKVKAEVAKQHENAQNYKTIANKNYEIWQANQQAVKIQQKNLSALAGKVSEAQKKLSDVSKEKQRQLNAVAQEMAQKRSERLRELSKELEDKRKKEEKKLKGREEKLTKRENAVTAREMDVDAVQFGGLDSKGVKHKSLEKRVKDGIARGIKNFQKALLAPVKAFTYAYRKSMVKQLHPTYTKDQVVTVASRQETYLAHKGGAKARILRELASDKYEKPSVKAMRSGTKALAKALPTYQAIDEAIKDSLLLDKLENAEKAHKQAQKQAPTVSKTKEAKEAKEAPDITDSL